MKTTTIVDVAKAAGVSLSVVSRVLMGRGYVQAEKKELVLKTMREMDYHPSPLAKGLRDSHTNTLGLLFFWLHTPFLPDYYQREIFAGVLDACVARNYQLLINNFVRDLTDVEAARFDCKRMLKDQRVEGLLVVNPPEALIPVFSGSPGRVALVNRREENLSYSDADHVSAMRGLVAYLAKKGHVRLGLLSGDPERDSSARPRRQAFNQCLRAHGLAEDPSLIWDGNFLESSGEEGARHLLSLQDPPTAIVASTDLMAIGALRALRKLGLAKVAVVGIDDVPLAATPEISLTTMRQPFYEMGRSAAEGLISSLASPGDGLVQNLLPMELIVRNSA
ncbi:MAG: LacI family DNA-binding transcriptional regulator [candidate division FCPU426 bacterium]